jgi:hypothetical protein
LSLAASVCSPIDREGAVLEAQAIFSLAQKAGCAEVQSKIISRLELAVLKHSEATRALGLTTNGAWFMGNMLFETAGL